MISRILMPKIQSTAKTMPVIGILGPRQSGKTTLAKAAFPNHKYFSLEDPQIFKFLTEDARRFFETHENDHGIIFDEAQRYPELFSYIQVISDEKKHNGYFVLTGSQNFLLLEKITQSLAGRIALFTLLPLSVEELKHANIVPKKIDDLLFQGCYPRIYQEKLKPQEWAADYITTYLERDVRLIKNVENLALFHKFLRLCAGRTGQLVNLTSLSNECGVSLNTIKTWLSLLEISYIIFMLQPHHENFNKRLVKTPKMYFYDTGLVCALVEIDSPQHLAVHSLRGELFETFILSEIMKRYANTKRPPRLYFWRDKAGLEIDGLIDRAGERFPLEIKSGHTIGDGFFSNLLAWDKIAYGLPKDNSIIYAGDDDQSRSNGSVFSWRHLNKFFEKIEL